MIVYHYKKYIKSIFDSFDKYKNYIDNGILKKYNKQKLTIVEFIDYYYDNIYLPLLYKLKISNKK